MRPRGTGSIYLRGKTYWCKYHVRGIPKRESCDTTDPGEAEKFLRKRLHGIDTGEFLGLAPERVTVVQLCKLVVQDYDFRRLRSKGDVQTRIKHITKLLGAIRASRFGSADLKRYITTRRNEEAADATINRELAVIRRGFTLAKRNDPPLVNRVPHIAALAEDNAREGFLEHGQYSALLKALPEYLRCLLVVGYHLGMRLGELLSLKWDQVDLQAGEIRLAGRQTKNKRPRLAPIYGDMKAWLQLQRESRDEWWPACPWVFSLLGKRLDDHLEGWRKACEAIGMPALLFHDLRRSAVRNMERAGVPRGQAMMISGHRTESVYRRYAIVSPADTQIAAAKLETFLAAERAAEEAREKKQKPERTM